MTNITITEKKDVESQNIPENLLILLNQHEVGFHS